MNGQPQKSREEYAAEQEKKKAEISEKIKGIVTSFEEDPDKMLEFLMFKSKFYNYSFGNSLLIYMQNPGASFVGSFLKFKQLGDEYAAHEVAVGEAKYKSYYGVNKGEIGMQIFVPIQTSFLEDENGNLIQLSKASKELKAKYESGQITSTTKTTFKLGSVFDIAQTSIPEKYYPQLLSMGYDSTQHKALSAALEAYCVSIGVEVKIEDMKTITTRGQASIVDPKIKLNDRLKDSQRADTFAHELGHNKMHHVDAVTALSIKTPTCIKEIEADIFSILIQSHLNLEILDTRKSHLKSSFEQYKEVKANSKEAKLPSLDDMVNHASQIFSNVLPDLEPFIDNLQKEDKDLDGIPDRIDSEFNPEVYRYMELKDNEAALLRSSGIAFQSKPSKNGCVIKYNAADEQQIHKTLAAEKAKSAPAL